jgi:prophage maintenance system killer protein
METMLVLNGYELTADVEEQEGLFLRLAGGKVDRSELAEWIGSNAKARDRGA